VHSPCASPRHIEFDCGPAGLTIIKFQDGPISEQGKNGIFIEDLLQICAQRLEAHQQTEFACPENEKALEHVDLALKALDSRSQKRVAQGVEGKSIKHVS